MGKTYLSRFFFFLVIGWWSLLDVEATAYSLRQFSSKNGLSNSAILSICQDCDGLIWIGSCDGLNVFDGTELRLYKPVDVRNNLSGNLIDNIMEAEGLSLKPWGIALKFLFLHHENILFPND